MSRRWPGPSPTTTSAAPAGLNATAAPMTTSGFVLIAVPGLVLHHVRLQKHALAAHIHAKLPKPAPDQVAEIHVVRSALRSSATVERSATWNRLGS